MELLCHPLILRRRAERSALGPTIAHRLCDTFTLNSLCWWKDGREGYPGVPGVCAGPEHLVGGP